jgi:DNA-binding MarR family transcriptional regulator
VTESLTAMLRSGQAMLVSRSADPATNRTVTVELTATIREP